MDSLGRIIDVKEHNGWTGYMETSWRTITIRENNIQKTPLKRKLNQLNGIESVVYWSDVSSEIIFILPNGSRNFNSSNPSGMFKINKILVTPFFDKIK